MNKVFSLLLLVVLSSAIQYPSVSEYLYVNVGETFRKPLTEFFSINEKWSFRIDGYPTEISLFNDDFDQTQRASLYSQEIKEIISAKPYLIDQYYHIGNLFGFLSKTENENYVFQFNSVISAQPKFDKFIDLTEETQGLICLDFDFYSQDEVIVVCVRLEEGDIKYYHFLSVNLQTSVASVIHILAFMPESIYNETTRLKLAISQNKSQWNSKILYLGAFNSNDQIKGYKTNSLIRQYRISDRGLDYVKEIDDVFISRNYKRKAGPILMDFTLIGDDILVIDKDTLGDVDAYLYRVGEEVLENKIDPLKIKVKRSTRAYIETSYVYLHKQEKYTKAKQYYLSMVFSSDTQTLTDSQDLLTSYSQLKYEDKGNNIIARISQNYKIILNTETSTLYVQNLYRQTYEKTLVLEGQPLGLITNQQTDSIIILYSSYSTQYSIQEPYIQVKPQTPRDLKTYYVVATYLSQYMYQVSFPFTYQALQYLDQSVYIKSPQTISRIDAKQINGRALTTTPIMVFGSCVELAYEKSSDFQFTVLKSKSSILTAHDIDVIGQNLHIAKRFTEGVFIIYRTNDYNQQLLSCNMDVDIVECTPIVVNFEDIMAFHYVFSQSSEKLDFGIQSQIQIDIYRDKQYSFTLKRTAASTQSFKMTGELLIIQSSLSLSFYLYQNQYGYSTIIYTIDRQLLITLGYQKDFDPQDFFINYDLSNLLIIQNKDDLIIGRYDSTFSIITILQATQDANIFVSISEGGFYVLEQNTAYQSLKAYSLQKNIIDLMIEYPLQGYNLLNDQAFDSITSVFAISATKDDKYCILVVDPKLHPRDAVYRVIFIEQDIQIKNLQITSQGDVLSITGFVNKQLTQYSTMRSAFFIEGQLRGQTNAFQKYNYLDLFYSNPDSQVITKQFVNIINDLNVIQAKEIDYYQNQVEQEGKSTLELPKDIFTGNIASYELDCEQCSSGNIYLQAPIFKTNREQMIGKQKQCVQYRNGLLVCINAQRIQIFDDYQLIDQYAINEKGVSIYYCLDNDLFIATLIDSSLVFLLKEGRIIIQSTSKYLIGYNQQMIGFDNQFILALHYGNYAKYDGYEIFEFIIEKGFYVLKSKFVKYVDNIQSCSYDGYFPAIQYVCGDQYLYYQRVTTKNQDIYFNEQFKIDIKQRMEEKDRVYLVDPKFIWIGRDTNKSYRFFLYDSDGNGYKVKISQRDYQDVYFDLLNILPTGRYQGLRVNSVKINEQFIVINRQFSDGDYVMIYKYESNPNYQQTYMIGAQKIISQVNILTQYSSHSTLGIQVEEEMLSSYNLNQSMSVVVKDGSEYNSQTLSIKGSNYYQSQQTSLYLEKPIIRNTSSRSSAYLWIYITFPVLIISGIISTMVYNRFKKKKQVGLLQQSLQQWQE